MKRKKRIELSLSKVLVDYKIFVEDISFLHKGHNNFDGQNETHMKITLKNKKNNNEQRLLIHRKINDALKDEFSLGLHAIEIKIINLV